MTRAEFIKKIEHYHGRVGGRDILDHFSQADFVIGCYYDGDTNMWKVFENEERGLQSIRLETTTEEQALDKLYTMIEIANKDYLYYKEWEAKKKKQE